MRQLLLVLHVIHEHVMPHTMEVEAGFAGRVMMLPPAEHAQSNGRQDRCKP